MESLLAYIPHRLIGDLLATPGWPLLGIPRRSDAVALFADISGFTPMSESLGRIGDAGTEELTGIINAYFATMIDLIDSFGGIVATFGGDAMMIIFPYHSANQQAVARQALACAFAMQERMAEYRAITTSIGVFSLAIKIGLAHGPILCMVVGEYEHRLQTLIAGGVLFAAAHAENAAERGQVVTTAALYQLVGLPALPADQPFAQISSTDRPYEAANPPLPPAPIAAAQVDPFLHPAVARRVRDGQASFLNEHRFVTVLFVGFDEIDYDRDLDASRRLQRYFSRVTAIIQRYGGDFNKIEIGDKGSKYLIVFGAPVGHEDDAARAMLCALDLHNIVGMSVRIGIAGGLAYCGEIGGSSRREYTVMGDIVNLAARLMQAATPGQVLVYGPTRRVVASRFLWQPPEQRLVKGRSEPVVVFPLIGQATRSDGRSSESGGVLIGRDLQLNQISALIDRVLSGRGQVLGISGEAGMGKSRLVAEVIRNARAHGLGVYVGECLSHGSTISYLPWRGLLTDLFGLDERWTLEQKIQWLQQRLNALGEPHIQRLPLLGIALNLPIDETDRSRSLEGRMRKEALEDTLLELVRRETRAYPLMLVIEDCHWIDPLSHSLLEKLARGLIDRPAMILAAYRPFQPDQEPLSIAKLINWSTIHLAELSPNEIAALIESRLGFDLGSESVPEPFVAYIARRAQGNPFFVDQLLSYLQERGIGPHDGHVLAELELPASLRALITSRIDQLAAEEQITIKVASVIGRLFRASWLWGVYPELGHPDAVRLHLDRLSALDLTPLERAEPEHEYLFKHVVTQEVAYESLAYATRTMLHDQTGAFIERTFSTELERYLDLLAFHYSRSNNRPKQCEYLLRAGEAAANAFANEAALSYYHQLLELLDGREKVDVLLRIGAIDILIGQWETAEAMYRQALALADREDDARARCLLALGQLLMSRGSRPDALEMLEDAYSIWDRQNDHRGRYRALMAIGYLQIDIADYPGALAYFQRALDLAISNDDHRLVAESIAHMGLVYLDTGEHDRALICLEQGAHIAQEFDDWGLMLRTRISIGAIFVSQGKLYQALPHFEQMLTRAREVGDRAAIYQIAGQLGRVWLAHGDPDEALTCFGYQIDGAVALGDQRNLAIGLGALARALGSIGQPEVAEEVAERASILCQRLRMVYWEAELCYDRAWRMRAAGRYLEGIAAAEQVIRLLEKYRSHRVLLMLARILAVELAYLTHAIRGTEAIAQLESLLPERAEIHLIARVHDAIQQIDPTRSENFSRALAAYRQIISEHPTGYHIARYLALGGTEPPLLPPLPELPELIGRYVPDVEGLIASVDELLGTPAE